MANELKDGGAAFPGKKFIAYSGGGGEIQLESGMTLRDWFAGQALVGLLANSNDTVMRVMLDEAKKCDDVRMATTFSRIAREYADAMLAELAKPQPEE